MAVAPIIDVTDRTTAITSASINKPWGSTSLIVTVDVTAGTSLQLRTRLEVKNALMALKIYSLNSSEMTGVGTYHFLYSEEAMDDIGSGITDKDSLPMPEAVVVAMVHNNANAATYTVTADWQ